MMIYTNMQTIPHYKNNPLMDHYESTGGPAAGPAVEAHHPTHNTRREITMNNTTTTTPTTTQDICPTCGPGCGCNLSVGPQPRLAARLDGTTLTITHSADSPWNQIPELSIKDHNGTDTHTLNLARGASTTLDHTPGNSIQIIALGDHPDHWETPHTEWSFQPTLTNGITTPPHRRHFDVRPPPHQLPPVPHHLIHPTPGRDHPGLAGDPHQHPHHPTNPTHGDQRRRGGAP